MKQETNAALGPPPIYRVPFSGVGYRYSAEDKDVVMQAMDSGVTLTQGTNQIEFEKKFAKFIGVPAAFATSSAATAFELAAILINLSPGDEVICPAHTYCASAYPFARHGVQMRWADIDRETFVVSVESVKSLITERTKAIIAVHLYGLPANLDQLREVANQANVLLVEDCAQSIGAKFGEAETGSVGDLSVYSFQSHKNISTLGEGGMLTVQNPELSKHVAGLRHNGHRPFVRSDSRYWYPAMSDVAFDIEGVWPHNFCMGEPQAAIGTVLLDRVADINSKRRSRFLYSQEALSAYPELVFQTIPNGRTSAHHLLPFRYDGLNYGANNHDFMERLAQQHLIQPATQYYPLNRYELFATSGNGEADVPNTDEFFDNMVSLPFHVWMPDLDFRYVVDSVAETAEYLRAHGGSWAREAIQ